METGDQPPRPRDRHPTALEYAPNARDPRVILSAGAGAEGTGTYCALSSAGSTSSRLVLVSSPDKSEIAALLECPVCYDIMIPPIVSCSKGHNVCSECRARIRHCPVCREMYSPGNLRNLLAEQLANKCQILCKFTNSGCSAVNTGNSLRNHQSGCNYRPLTCPDCDSVVTYEQFLEHVQDHEVHQIQQSEYSTGYEIQETDFSSPPQKWELTWLYCYNSNFLCHTEKHENCWSFWISCAENNDELDDYICEIILWNKEKRNEVKYRGPINSVRTKAKDVLSNASGLIMTKDTIRAYVSRGGIDLVFRIAQAQYEVPRIARNNNIQEEQETPVAHAQPQQSAVMTPEREHAMPLPLPSSPGMDDFLLAGPPPQPHPHAALDNDLSDDFESLSGSSEAGDGVGDGVGMVAHHPAEITNRQLMRFETRISNGSVRRVMVSVSPRGTGTSDARQRSVAATAAEAPNEDEVDVDVEVQTVQINASSPPNNLAASNNRNQQANTASQGSQRLSPSPDANSNSKSGTASSPPGSPQAQDRRPGRPPPQPPGQNSRNNPRVGVGVPTGSGPGVCSGAGAGAGRGRGYGRGSGGENLNMRGSPISDSVENGF